MKEKLKKLKELVDHFDSNIETYKGRGYDESNTRSEFIDKFFELLDWDVYNSQGFSENYKEVKREDKVTIEGRPKAPDYSFRVGGVRKFFTEAKKPSINIKDDFAPAFQIRRYGYTAKLPLCILTDFEEFAVYDTRVKPNKKDKATTARLFYCKYDEYEELFAQIYGRFSKTAILTGSFDKYAQDNKIKRGASEIDKEFLKLIETWRSNLARNIALRNKELSLNELNFFVQQIIDRIIFLRIAEDRDMEEYKELYKLTDNLNVYDSLKDLFIKADKKYNSGLFEVKKSSPNLNVDDKVLNTIIRGLYYPDCPYEFSVLGVEVLGNIYEQFLGKTINLNKAHQASIEEKPEVKKAGGVYYTPQYIVDYIVKSTVGAKIKGKNPDNVSKLKICDPACGSGSFLLGAYNHLLEWHLDWYSKEKNRIKALKTGKIYQTTEKDFCLSINEKQHILLNNLYGVDIDSQAVEVTKLSLLLKLMEGENQESAGQMFKYSETQLLPNLSKNIKCGNSLIGSDFYKQQDLGLFDEEKMRKVNVFDWEDGFKDIFKDGGFDCIIGNPPYIRIQILKEWAPENVDYFSKPYQSAQKGNYDIYLLFVEQGLKLLNKNGLLGFILPHKFFNAKYGEMTRSLLAQNNNLKQIVHFGFEQIFKGATTYTCLLFLSKQSNKSFEFERVDDIEKWKKNEFQEKEVIESDTLSEQSWNFLTKKEKKVFNKLEKSHLNLENVTDRIFQGLKTGGDKVFIIEERLINNNKIKVYSRATEKEHWIETALLHPLVKGGDSKAYHMLKPKRLILFPYLQGVLINEEDFKKNYPKAWEYLNENKKTLEERERGKMKGRFWYSYSRSQALNQIIKPKIFTPDIAPRASFSFDEEGKTFFTGGAAGGYGILVQKDIDPKYILGLLNSSLLNWQLKRISTMMRGGYLSFESRYISKLSVKLPSPAEQQSLVKLVQYMIDAKNMLSKAKTEIDKQLYEQNCKIIDGKINDFVFELFDITPSERKFITENIKLS